jgi:hypothetical protein
MEGDRIICDLSVLIDVEGQTPTSFEYVKDMYSTENESTCLFRDYTVPSIGYCTNGNFSMNERISKENLSIPEGARIVDIYGNAWVDSTESSGEKMNVLGNVKYTLIISANDEYSSMEIVLPAKYEFDCNNENMSSYESKMSVLSCKAREDSDYIGIDAEIGISSMGYSNNKIMVLDEISFDNRIERRKGEITVCYPNENDSLWSIGKKHHISVEHIEKINGVEGNIGGRDYLII